MEHFVVLFRYTLCALFRQKYTRRRRTQQRCPSQMPLARTQHMLQIHPGPFAVHHEELCKTSTAQASHGNIRASMKEVFTLGDAAHARDQDQVQTGTFTGQYEPTHPRCVDRTFSVLFLATSKLSETTNCRLLTHWPLYRTPDNRDKAQQANNTTSYNSAAARQTDRHNPDTTHLDKAPLSFSLAWLV